MASNPKPNLNPIRPSDIALAILAFAVGAAVGFLGLSFCSRETPDLGPFFFMLIAMPLALSPFIYVVGFLLQESALAQRSRRAQFTSGVVSGFVYVLLLGAAIAFGEYLEQFLELPQWMSVGALGVLWAAGPVVVAIASLGVERRFAAQTIIDGDNAS